MNARIARLPESGGTIDARDLTGAQNILSTIVINKPTHLRLGAATFTCSAKIAGACIQVTRPSRITMMRGVVPIYRKVPIAAGGTTITAEPGYSGFLISIEGKHWTTAMGTLVEGGVLDGNLQQASGIHIENQFGVKIRDVIIIRPRLGVQLENTHSLWTEGSSLSDIFISDPGVAGIQLTAAPSGSKSVANAMWDRVYISLLTDGSSAIDSGDVLFSASRVELLKIWMETADQKEVCKSNHGIRMTGLRARSHMIGTVFASMNVEADSCSNSTLKAVDIDAGAIRPKIELMVQGSPRPSVNLGREFRDGEFGVAFYSTGGTR